MKNNVIQMPQPHAKAQEKIDETALHWLMEIDRGALSPKRKAELIAWIESAPAHKVSFLAHAKLWDELDVLSELSNIIPFEQQQTSQQKSPKYYLYAASVIFVVAFAMLFVRFNLQPTALGVPASQIAFKQSYQTNTGELKTIQLPDGSALTLNTNSRVTAQFDQNYRNVSLEYGELHIQVAHDHEKPLNILVNDKMIQAVGTSFNVQYLSDKAIQLIVSDGKVMLANSTLLNDKVNFAKLTKPLNQTLMLKAGQKVSINATRTINSLKSAVEDVSNKLDLSLSWLTGSLTFAGEPLEQVIAQVNRYLTHPIHLANDDVRSVRVIGRFEQGKLDNFLTDLQRNFNVHLSHNAQGEIILSKK